MTDEELAESRSLLESTTPGPWQWFGNTKQYEVYLATKHSGRRFVMDFVRWGMGGAQPRFQVTIDGNEAGGGVMRSIAQLAEGDANAKGRLPLLGPLFEVDYRRQFVGIGHPDAQLIAAAPTLTRKLLDEVDRLRKLVAMYEQPRIVHLDADNCRHNNRVEPETGECLDCGTVLP